MYCFLFCISYLFNPNSHIINNLFKSLIYIFDDSLTESESIYVGMSLTFINKSKLINNF